MWIEVLPCDIAGAAMDNEARPERRGRHGLGIRLSILRQSMRKHRLSVSALLLTRIQDADRKVAVNHGSRVLDCVLGETILKGGSRLGLLLPCKMI